MGRLVVPSFAPLEFHEGSQPCGLIVVEPFTRCGETRNSVNSECAEVLPEFAPSGEHPASGQIPDHQRVHTTLGSVSVSILVVELRDLPPTDCPTEQGKLRRCAACAPKTEVRSIREPAFLRLRHACLDFCTGFASRFRQNRIAGAFREGKAYGKRIDLVVGKRHIGQVKARSQQITDAGFALDRQAGGLEVGNVAIDRADADFKLLREFVGPADATGSQFVDQSEQPLGTSHRFHARSRNWKCWGTGLFILCPCPTASESRLFRRLTSGELHRLGRKAGGKSAGGRGLHLEHQ